MGLYVGKVKIRLYVKEEARNPMWVSKSYFIVIEHPVLWLF